MQSTTGLPADASGFDSTGLTSSQLTGDFSGITVLYSGVTTKFEPFTNFLTKYTIPELKGIIAMGTIAPGQSFSIAVPLTLPARAAIPMPQISKSRSEM